MKNRAFTKFTAKMAISVFLLCGIPVFLMAFWFLNNTVNKTEKNQLQLLDHQIYLALAESRQNIEEVMEFYNSIYSNNALNYFFTRDFYTDIELITKYSQEINPTLSWLSTLKPASIHSFTFYTQNPALLETTTIQFLQQETQQRIETEEFSFPLITYAEEGTSPSMLFPLNARVLDKNTYLELHLDSSEMFRSLINFSETGNASLQIYDRSGALFYTNGISWPGQDASTSLSSSLSKNPDIPAFYAAEYSLSSGFYARIAIPESVIRTHLDPLIRLFTFVLLAAILLLATVIFIYFQLSLRRLKNVISAVETIQTGNFDVTIPHQNRDVIDKLADRINTMSARIKALINQVYVAELKQKKLMVSALQKQINPHFLYNTLESIRMKAEIQDQEEISNNIAALGGIMRYNISQGKDFETLENEMAYIGNYIEIQNLFRNGRIHWTKKETGDCSRLLVPKFCLQPLVENSILHGLSHSHQHIHITIGIKEQNGTLSITVSDDGVGADAETIAEMNRRFQDYESTLTLDQDHGIALYNINSRVRLTYGKEYGLWASANSPTGFSIRLLLPT